MKAVDDVSFDITQGKIVGLVGESGSGKSTLGRSILRLVDSQAGNIWYESQDLRTLDSRQMKPLRRQLQMVFQDPYASLNPRMTLFETLSEPLLLHGLATRKTVGARVVELLEEVGLESSFQHKYPHEFSGGQRQRIAIGRAIACQPKFIVADEPVSALDVTIQAQIIELLLKLVKQHDLTLLFISHDLAVVRAVCDHILVMHHGVIVEEASTETLFTNPQHAYTQKLLSAIPQVLGAYEYGKQSPPQQYMQQLSLGTGE